MKALALFSAFALSFASVASAAPTSFDFKDPKGVNHIIFMLDAPLEFISGTGKGVSGSVVFDAEAPEKISGKIVLESSSLVVPNETMTSHMHGDRWLGVQSHPEITFEVQSLSVDKKDGNTFEGTVSGNLTLKGKTLPVKAPAKITFVSNGAVDRNRAASGDLLVVRADFGIKLSDFGISLNAAEKLKVADDVVLKVVIAGRS